MFKQGIGITILALALATLVSADSKTPSPKLSADQIADRNVEARGGLQTWRSVRALTLTGKMDAGGNQRPTIPVPGVKRRSEIPRTRPIDQVQLPFTMDLARPHKQRLELDFSGQTAVQVFDGTNGWKWRPFLNRGDVESFTPEELKIAGMQSELDGPLVDYGAKGTRLELEGTDQVEGKDSYKLKLTMKNGQTMRVWIDAQTFLENKMEGTPRRLDGVYHPVEVYLKDYRAESGLMIPHLLETKVLPVKTRPTKGIPSGPRFSSTIERIMVEDVKVNPKLDDALFAKPQPRSSVDAKNVSPAAHGHSLP
jgi:outer membrane lipoprotein-sorting protein